MSYSETITYEDLKRILETIPLSTITYGRGEVGEIKPFAGSTIPTGWLLCDGSAVSRTTYSELFTVIGTTYGTGDGSTTFNLPDLRDRFMVGAGDTYNLNSKGGASTVTLDTTMIPAHTHGSKTLSGYFGMRKWGAGDSVVYASGIVSHSSPSYSASTASGSSTNPNKVDQITVTATHEHNSVGGGEAHNNLPPYIGINFIIYAKNTKTVVTPQIDLFYPVGAYFETSDSTFDPNVKWGGTWVSEINGVVKADCNYYVYRYYGNSTNVTQTGTTRKDVITLTYTSNTGKVLINANMPLYTSRYTSSIYIEVDGTVVSTATTNTQTTTAYPVDNVPLASLINTNIGQEITVKIQISAQDSGTTATVPGYHDGRVIIQDLPVGTGYRWHRTA